MLNTQGLLFPSPPIFFATNWYFPSSDFSIKKMFNSWLFPLDSREEYLVLSDVLIVSSSFNHRTSLSGEDDVISPRNVTRSPLLFTDAFKSTTGGSAIFNNIVSVILIYINFMLMMSCYLRSYIQRGAKME